MGSINPTTDGSPTDNPYIDSLLWGGSWAPSLGAPASLTWSLLDSAKLRGGPSPGLTWSAGEEAAITRAFSLWSEVSGLTFERLATGPTDIGAIKISAAEMQRVTGSATVLGIHDTPDGSTFDPPVGGAPAVPGCGCASCCGEPLIGAYNDDGRGWSPNGLQQGGYGFISLLHEIGHGLGLAHPHDGGGDDEVFPGVDGSTDPGTDQLNQGIFSTMSYVDGWRTEYPGHLDVRFGWQGTPMAFDIAAIQTLYGANLATRTGDDVYALPLANGPGGFWSCIWDAGGIDTLTAAGATAAANLDLRAAPLAGPDAGGYVSYVPGVIGGFTIANGVVIENAEGGAGDDRITGNAAANRLDGGAGTDTLTGGVGDDIYVVDAAGDRTIEVAGEGLDTVLAAIGTTLAAEVEGLVLTGTAASWGTGNALANRITGNAAANRLAGLGGDDTLAGGGGGDRLIGGGGADRFQFTAGSAGDGRASRVIDFDPLEDLLALVGAGFEALAPGFLAAELFGLGSAAADATDRILYDARSGLLRFDADGSGSEAALIVARLGKDLDLEADVVFIG